MPEGTPDRVVDATLDASDIQLGAVEVKDATSDNRQAVSSDGRAAVALPAKTVVSAEFARTADTTTYTARDVVGPAVTANLTFADVARANGGTGYVVGAELLTTILPTTLVARFRLHLFSTAPTAIADNAPYTMLYANRAIRVGAFDFPAAGVGGGSGTDVAWAQNIIDRLPFKCAAADDNLYGILETLDGITTPTSAATTYIRLAIERD